MGPIEQHVAALTGIRALALAMVLSLHVSQGATQFTASAMPYLSFGYLGVDLFFILSGYINAYVYFDQLRAIEIRQSLQYLWRRLIRIYPAHVAVIGLVAFRHALAGTVDTLPLSDLPNELTLTHAWFANSQLYWNSPSWSVSAEWFAYLLFPIIVPLVNSISRTSLITFTLAGAVLFLMEGALVFEGAELNSWRGQPALVRIFGEFSCGVLLCRAVAMANVNIDGDVIGVLGCALLFVGIVFKAPWQAFPFFLAMIVLGAATAVGIFQRLFSLGPLVWLGMVSYSIYISHSIVFDLTSRSLRSFSLPPEVVMASAIASAIVMGAALFYFAENPIRSFLHRVSVGQVDGSRL